jgi:mRNA-binding protein PUF3
LQALDHVLVDQQGELVREMRQDIMKLLKDQNGNHVVQKAIECIPKEIVPCILDAFKGQVHTLASHNYGCRVIQRMMEYCPEKDQASIIEELHACAQMLITDQYGNYVIQHVIRHGKLDDRNKLIDIVTAQVMTLSKHKYASNVVESVMEVGTYEQRQAIISQFTAKNSDGSSPLQLLMKDQFGNYVIRKSSLWYCLDHLTAISYTNVVQSAA